MHLGYRLVDPLVQGEKDCRFSHMISHWSDPRNWGVWRLQGDTGGNMVWSIPVCTGRA
jgi:hypothetical protein